MEKISFKKIKRFSTQKETLFLSASLVLIISTPLIVSTANPPIKKEFFELILLSAFSVIALISAYLYEKKVSKKKNEAEEVLNYLGTINLQFAHVKSIFEDLKKFPESKNDFKLLLSLVAEKALSINNADWVIFRIVDLGTKRILIEHNQARGGKTLPQKKKTGNQISPEERDEDYIVIESTQDNLGLKTFCILSGSEINDHQKSLMGILINNLSIYYLLFVSIFHKK